MIDTDMLYMASLQKHNKELDARVSELEDKHFSECRQIARYDDELRRAKELLREAQVLIKHSLFVNCKDTATARDWCDKLRKLIGEDINVSTREESDPNA